MTFDRIGGRPVHPNDSADTASASFFEELDLSAPYAAWVDPFNNGPLFPIANAPAPAAQTEPGPACMLDGFASSLAVTNAETVGTIGAADMLVPQATQTYKVDGTGIRIGILSDSFNLQNGMSADIAAGLLPADGVTILQEGPAGSHDEGRAMAELVHEVAPGAQIDFYTAFNGETDFANGIIALAQAGCSIIVDDVTYFDEPFFQDGSALQAAVEAVTAEGVSYFTSASNSGENFYQASFTPVAATLPGGVGAVAHAQNFGGGSALQSLTIAGGQTVIFDLQWDQPFADIGTGHSSANSLALYLFTAAGAFVASAVQSDVGGNPVQILPFTNNLSTTSFELAIVWNGGSVQPGLLKYIVYSSSGGAITINDVNAGIGSGSVTGHEMIPAANTVGAVNANTGTSPPTLEPFSSVGPGEILFDANGNRLAQPIDPNKINFTAPDGIATSVFNPFFGTSAAAPNAAAVAALMLQANPNLTPAQVTDDLAQRALVMNGGSNTADGAGFIQAPGAVAAAFGVVWATAAGGLWSTGAGWTGGSAPTASTPATLSDDFGTLSASYFVIVDNTSAVADTLTVGDTSKLTPTLIIGSGSKLGITAGATVGQNGTLTDAGTLAVGGIAQLTDPTAALAVQSGATMTAQVLEIGVGAVTLEASATLDTTGSVDLVLTFGGTNEAVPIGLATGGGTLSVGGSGAALTVGSGGVLFGGGTAAVASGATLADNGGTGALMIVLDTTVTDQGVLTTSGGMLLNTGANVAVTAGGRLSAASIDVEGTGSTLDIAGTATDGGDLTGAMPGSVGIENQATLSVGGSLVGAGIDLSGGGLLELTSTISATLLGGFTSVITLINQGGGEIDLAGVPYNNGTNSLSLNGGTLAIASGGTTLADLVFPSAANYQFTQANDAGALQLGVACYCRGTRIATPAGETAIEALRIGDLVLTASNAVRPIRWIGRRRYDAERIGSQRHLQPVRIRAGALGADARGPVPMRDLRVSPEHALGLHDAAGKSVLVPARLLVNGVSILRESAAAAVEYLHVELKDHDIILAEGAPAETFIDCDSRALFDNAAEFSARYSREAVQPPRFRAPRIESGPALVHVRGQLERIAGIVHEPIGGADGSHLGRADLEGVAGWAHDRANPDCAVLLEVVVDGEVVGTVLADRFRGDLERAGLAGGYCAFTWEFPRPLDADRRHIISVRRAADAAELHRSPLLLDRRETMETMIEDMQSGSPGRRREMAEFLTQQAEALSARSCTSIRSN